MSDTNCMLSRQPIYSAGMNVAAYELRTQGPQPTIFGMFTDAGLDLVVGEHPGLVSLSPDALAEGLWKAIPKSRVMLGYFYDFPPSSVTAQLLSKLSKEGYRLGLSGALNAESMSLVDNTTHLIKVDVTQYSPDELEKRVNHLRNYKPKILAEKVDTLDDWEFCKELKLDFYEGHFLFRPAAKQKQIPVSRLMMMRLLSKLQNPDIVIPEIEKLVSQDVALSYKLLKYVNSPAVALPRQVHSVGHAVRLIGIETLRIWASALLMSTIEDKPRELMTTALVRARMCQLLGESVREIPKESFLSAGLLSVIDALLDCPMEQAVAELPLTQDIKDALIHGSGKIGQALRCIMSYERAAWDEVQFCDLPHASIHEKYMHSLGWARQITSGMLS
jgi:EAL and modified HD-GYP domain-containing signal transduction protein